MWQLIEFDKVLRTLRIIEACNKLCNILDAKHEHDIATDKGNCTYHIRKQH